MVQSNGEIKLVDYDNCRHIVSKQGDVVDCIGTPEFTGRIVQTEGKEGKGREQKGTEGKGREQKGTEGNRREGKGTEGKGTERNGWGNEKKE